LPLAAALAALAFGVTFIIAASNGHTPARVDEVAAVRAMVFAVPFVAAALAALAIFRPLPAFLGILLFTPVWDAAQIDWSLGGFPITIQTVFVVALGVGCLVWRLRTRTSGREATARDPASQVATGGLPRSSSELIAPGVAGVALIAILMLALLSTYFSPSVSQSSVVLVHGIIEPIALGLILLALRPSRMDLARVAIVLGVSAGLGCAINIIQTVPGAPSLAALQARRLYFSLVTYDNVGLLGDLLAMAVPLLVGVLLARRSLRLRSSTSTLLLLGLAACLAGLFLTFSKSAWLAASFATALLALLAVRSWPGRLTIVAAAGVLSAIVVPWPALVLQLAPNLNSTYRVAMVRIEGARRFDSWNPATVAGQGSVMFRLRAAEAGLHMAVDHPLLGVGLNQYKRYYLAGYSLSPIDLHIDHAHSIWPELAAELGFPAMALVALLYAAALLALWHVYRNPPDSATRLLAATFIAAIVAWVIVSTVFGTDIYRSPRSMASEIVTMTVLMAAAFSLAWSSRHGRTVARATRREA
jgi:O-antigen ligase